MKQEMVQIPKNEYEELLEEVGILRNAEMMEAIKQSDEAKKKGVKTWDIKTHL
ncbi:hypothetical protein J4448_05475 [Candidatus Woesearchaeota archaeon]|nr:hypothetical protein [Candidatus Woesearchaeota archaeon]